MSFVLRIFLSGLIALVPNEEGDKMTVLFVDAVDGYKTSAGKQVPEHYPLLIARAGECSSDASECRRRLPEATAKAAYGKDSGLAATALEEAIRQGLVWQLDGEDITFVTGAKGGLKTRVSTRKQQKRGAPSRGAPREESWIVEMARMGPNFGEIDPAALSKVPNGTPVIARTSLSSGTASVHRFVHSKGRVIPITFKNSRGQEPEGWRPQPVADWLVVDIEVPGCHVEIQRRGFGGGPARTARLGPAKCGGDEVVEVALVNLPMKSFVPASPKDSELGSDAGRHFEIFFQLAKAKDAGETFLPHAAGGAAKDVPRQGATSDLLLGLFPKARGSYSHFICPFVKFLPMLGTDASPAG